MDNVIVEYEFYLDRIKEVVTGKKFDIIMQRARSGVSFNFKGRDWKVETFNVNRGYMDLTANVRLREANLYSSRRGLTY